MKVEIHITIKSDDGQIQEQEQIACLQRGMLTPEELGMNLAEAKELMHSVQETMVRRQTTEYVKEQSVCLHCGKKRSLKGNHEIVYRTLFWQAEGEESAPVSVSLSDEQKAHREPLGYAITGADRAGVTIPRIEVGLADAV
jgi:hypothetical protein